MNLGLTGPIAERGLQAAELSPHRPSPHSNRKIGWRHRVNELMEFLGIDGGIVGPHVHANACADEIVVITGGS